MWFTKLYIYTQPLRTSRIRHKVKFQVDSNKFEFSVCLLLNLLLSTLNSKLALLFTHSLREDNWIHTLPKSINTRPGFELGSPYQFPTTVAITPQACAHAYIYAHTHTHTQIDIYIYIYIYIYICYHYYYCNININIKRPQISYR